MIGGIVGGVLLLLLVFMSLFFCRRRQRGRSLSFETATPYPRRSSRDLEAPPSPLFNPMAMAMVASSPRATPEPIRTEPLSLPPPFFDLNDNTTTIKKPVTFKEIGSGTTSTPLVDLEYPSESGRSFETARTDLTSIPHAQTSQADPFSDPFAKALVSPVSKNPFVTSPVSPRNPFATAPVPVSSTSVPAAELRNPFADPMDNLISALDAPGSGERLSKASSSGNPEVSISPNTRLTCTDSSAFRQFGLAM
ncbi:hypothetical protein K435DRAFT_81317 [Dendrothele bispora CBS 962.96]|uniref:Uncharacterized protein n=1 Tax=Dendrothele bispora (strain CBS 962.96) TaxID=1314807 RepID=A0A4S8M3Y5_DENBC|nr:hypothetical protein K435DRAFT_81317 [Dendrothele bispora CBS 962.96]